jgi:hypothetical protein
MIFEIGDLRLPEFIGELETSEQASISGQYTSMCEVSIYLADLGLNLTK